MSNLGPPPTTSDMALFLPLMLNPPLLQCQDMELSVVWSSHFLGSRGFRHSGVVWHSIPPGFGTWTTLQLDRAQALGLPAGAADGSSAKHPVHFSGEGDAVFSSRQIKSRPLSLFPAS